MNVTIGWREPFTSVSSLSISRREMFVIDPKLNSQRTGGSWWLPPPKTHQVYLLGNHLIGKDLSLGHIFSCILLHQFFDLKANLTRGWFEEFLPSFSSQDLFLNWSFKQYRVATFKPACKNKIWLMCAGFLFVVFVNYFFAFVWADEVTWASYWHFLAC